MLSSISAYFVESRNCRKSRVFTYSICWVPYLLILYGHETCICICIIICMSDKDGFSPIPYAEYHICLFCMVMKLSEKPGFHLTVPYAEFHMCLFCIVTKLSAKPGFSFNYSICRVPYVLFLYSHETVRKSHVFT